MKQQELTVEQRNATGKGVARKLRANGMIPGIVYGKGIESVAVSVSPKDLVAAIAGEGGMNNLITLKGAGSVNGSVVIVADLLRDPLKGVPMHVDFHKVNMNEKIRVQVTVTLVGTAAGVKEGGLLDFSMHRVTVECLPSNIPEHIEVDVTSLTIGHSIHISDVAAPAGMKILEDAKASVVSVLGRAKEEAAPAEGAAPAGA